MLTDAQIHLLGREAGLLFTRKENIIFARAIEAAVIEAGASGAAQDAAWISVEDRLPEPDVEVLCAGRGWASAFVTACYYDDEHEGWWQIGSHYTDAHDGQQYPTHWMPLPKPPAAIDEAVEAQQRGSGNHE